MHAFKNNSPVRGDALNAARVDKQCDCSTKSKKQNKKSSHFTISPILNTKQFSLLVNSNSLLFVI